MFASYHVHRARPSDRAQILQLQADSVLDGGHGVDDAGVIEALHDEPAPDLDGLIRAGRSEEHTSELQSLMRLSYAVFCLNKNTSNNSSTPIIPTAFTYHYI